MCHKIILKSKKSLAMKQIVFEKYHWENMSPKHEISLQQG